MSKPIEDYGFIGNTVTGALVARDGSIDWLCVPHFDNGACFAALLGEREHGHWQLAPAGEITRLERRYLPGTAVLETCFETAEGRVTVTDFMPRSEDERHVELIRVVRGERGRVRMRMQLTIRFDYGHIVPWVRREGEVLVAMAGPDALRLYTPASLHGEGMHTIAAFEVEAGENMPFVLAYDPSHRPAQAPRDWRTQLEQTVRDWRQWSQRCRFDAPAQHPWREAVLRSLITLKALTFSPTGGIVAAPTTSLPEEPGGVRNWDYRFCWLRDATLSLYALLGAGYREEAAAWRDWLMRAAGGDPGQLQVFYGLAGERRLPECELPWLPGHAHSTPVRIGNAAYAQRQLDVAGELMDAVHAARKQGIQQDEDWPFQLAMLERLEKSWREPDEGIWEVRGGARHFTFSRMMCWVAFDRGIRAVEDYGCEGPVARWRRIREDIARDIHRHGWNERKQAFVQSYGKDTLDASLLLMAQVGFLPARDARYVATVAAIERELLVDGLVRRYQPERADDGLPGSEGLFLACSFWLADAYVLLGRHDDAVALFERLLTLRNDLGLLAEEYDVHGRRQLGNFPQAFSHIALINTANNLVSAFGPAEQRADGDGKTRA